MCQRLPYLPIKITVTVVIQNGNGAAVDGKTQEVNTVQWVMLESSDTIRDNTEFMNCLHVGRPDSIKFLLI